MQLPAANHCIKNLKRQPGATLPALSDAGLAGLERRMLCLFCLGDVTMHVLSPNLYECVSSGEGKRKIQLRQQTS